MSRLLFDLAQESTVVVAALNDDDYVDDYLMIERVGPGALWFEGESGPVKVPEAASDLAQPGWSVNIVIARAGDTWQVLESRQRLPPTVAAPESRAGAERQSVLCL